MPIDTDRIRKAVDTHGISTEAHALGLKLLGFLENDTSSPCVAIDRVEARLLLSALTTMEAERIFKLMEANKDAS